MDMSKCLDRFLEPQRTGYPTALKEVGNSRKVSHWMWYIFPQLRGLGQSHMAWYYGIEGLEEAKHYLTHPVLGQRLREITAAALELSDADPGNIFGWPDDMKFRSCMTLFSQVSQDGLFQQALDRFFGGQADEATLYLLRKRGDIQ